MKHNVQFNHTKKGLEAFGISDERSNEMLKFTTDMMDEARKNKWKKSQIMERIIDFSDNVAEACHIFGFLERANALIKGLQMKGKIQVEIVNSPDDIPDEIRDMIKRDISRIEKTIRRRDKKDGVDPALN